MHLDREQAGHSAVQQSAETAEDLIDLIGVAQEAAANIFLINFGRGTAKIQVDAGDGMAQKLFNRAGEVGQIFTNELGKDGPAGGVFVNGPQDVFFRTGLRVDAEKLGEEIIGRSVVCDNSHEGEVGHVLHGREGRKRQARGEWRRQGRHRTQDGSSSSSPGSPSSSSDCCLRTRSRISVWSSTVSKTFCAA
jgi:hypothetical protein